MKISIFGLGYVGAVTATCCAELRHEVVGVEINPNKVNLINRRQSPIVEPGLQERVTEVVRAGRLTATVDAEAAIGETAVSLICVGNRVLRQGRFRLRPLIR